MEITLDKIREITGLPFQQKGSRFISATYIDGTPHSRKDKTYVIVKPYGIFIKENGGEDLYINDWIEKYGDGVKLNCNKIEVKTEKIDTVFVSESYMESTIPIIYKSLFFKFISNIFGYDKTTEVFHKYNVGEKDDKVIFWYKNYSGNVCFNMNIFYNQNCKRVRDAIPFTNFREDEGFNAKCLFGEHLLRLNKNNKVNVVESEKTAIICDLADNSGKNIWMATGGNWKLFPMNFNYFLYPDFDKAGFLWLNKPNSIKWWEIIKGYDIKEGDDLADYLIFKYGSKNKK